MSGDNPVHITDPSTGIQGNVTASGAQKVDGSAVTQPVSGTVTAAQATAANLNATVVGSGSFTVAQATAANLLATVTQGGAATLSSKWPVQVTDGTNTMPTADVAARAMFHKLVDTGGVNVAAVSAANALKVDGSAVTQPVSGTVTANAGTGPFPIIQGLPSTANILGGSATTTGSTIITIPINRVWAGWITLSAALTAGASALTSQPTVTIQSSGTCFPASATILAAITMTTGASITDSSANGVTNQIFVIVGAPTATNTATLQLNAGSGTAPTAMLATAVGVLL